MPAYPKNYPFYSWVPKPIGIIILFMFFLPILTVGGTYSASGTEMMSGLGSNRCCLDIFGNLRRRSTRVGVHTG